MAKTTCFFLGANSGDGFQSLFQDLMNPADTYDFIILKGGPGVGKSTFLRQVGKTLEQAGTPVEYILCSGDPDSLDAVILPELHCALTDGTSPHVLEPHYPGAVDRCVDLGRFYDVTAAKAERQQIICLIEDSADAYRQATHCLGAARQIELAAIAEVQRTMDWKRAERRLDGMIQRELAHRGRETGMESRRFLGGITCRGALWKFDSVQALCPRVYEFADSWELAGPLLERLRRTAQSRGWNTVTCFAPEDPARVEHLLIPGLGLAFITSRAGMEYPGTPYRRIRLDALTEPTGKARLRFSRRMTALLREEAVEHLQQAKAAHDALEQLYNPYVDFDGVRTLAAMESGRFLSYLR